jgi:hypothetical protein
VGVAVLEGQRRVKDVGGCYATSIPKPIFNYLNRWKEIRAISYKIYGAKAVVSSVPGE